VKNAYFWAMFSFLNQPYPKNDDSRKIFKQMGLVSVFVVLFLFIFQPFGRHSMSQGVVLVFCIMYGMVTLTITSIFLLFIPQKLPRIFNEENWTVKKELTHIAIMIILLAMINSFIGIYIQTTFSIIHGSVFLVAFKSFYITVAIALIPTSILILWQQNRLLLMYQKEANEIEENLETRKSLKPETICISGEGKNEEIQFHIDQLFYVKSNGNYCDFIIGNQENTERSILRINLKSVENSLMNHDKILKTHRSYLVNKNKVEHVSGNAQGLKLKLIGIDEPIPVSRANTEWIKKALA